MSSSASSANREILSEKNFLNKISLTVPVKPTGAVASKMNTFLEGIRVAVEKNNNNIETDSLKVFIRNLQLPEGVSEIQAQQYCSSLKSSMDNINIEEKSAFNIKCREYQPYVDAGEAEYLQFDKIIKLLSQMDGNDYTCSEEDLNELIERSVTIACGAKLEKQRRLFLAENRARHIIQSHFISAPALPANKRGRPSPFASILELPPSQRQRGEVQSDEGQKEGVTLARKPSILNIGSQE